MEHSDAGFGGVGKNRSRAVDEINILAAEIFDRIYNLLCEDSGDIWCHNKNSCKLLAGCFALFFLGVHFFISKIDVVVKSEDRIIRNDKADTCFERKNCTAGGGELFKGSQDRFFELLYL